MKVVVHPRVIDRRPNITEGDVLAAVENSLRTVPRLATDPLQWAGVGLDVNGRLLQFVAVELGGPSDCWLVYHAMPVTEKMLREVGLK